MSALDRLRTVAERPSPGAWYSQGEVSDWTHNGSETTSTPEADAEFVVTFDPAVVLALLDVAEAADVIATDDYLQQPPPYAQGIRVEEAVALTEAIHRLREAIDG